MDYIGRGTGANASGWERNADKHFQELLNKHPEYWSPDNKRAIENHRNPKVDSQFTLYFPQYSNYMDDKLIHYHIGGGGQATSVPSTVHNGYGGIHNVERQHGIRGNDRLTGVGQTFQPERSTRKKKSKK